jgi:diguanylate cyclase (GGDEF)-like protein
MTASLRHLPVPDAPLAAERRRLAALDALEILDTPPEAAYDDIALLAQVACDVPVALVALIDRDRQWFKARAGTTLDAIPRDAAACAHASHDPERVLQVADATRDPRFREHPLVVEPPYMRFYASAPVVTGDGHALGAVCVMDRRVRRLDERQQHALQALARQVALLLELRAHHNRRETDRDHDVRRLMDARDDLQRRNADLKQVALHDELTGLLNRAGLNRLRGKREAMAQLEGGNYVVAVMDLDLFKRINDRHGHLAGDAALQAVARAVSGSIRATDVAVRYGGEEFLLVFPRTPLGKAYEVAERIREAVAACDLPFPLTVSIGLAAGDPKRDTPEAVFERADQALYRAKAAGRNCVAADDTQQV